MRHFGLIAMLVFAVLGCDRRHAELQKALSESRAAEAQKDSLLTEVLETTQFVSDVNSELAKARSVAIINGSEDGGAPGAQRDREERKATLARIQQVIARLNESEAKLTATENRAKNARNRNARLLAQISTYKRTIEDLKAAAEQQRAENEAIIADQRSQIALLAGQVDTLDRERNTLRGSVANLITYKNTVFYAVGTKDELIEKGVVKKEGSKFLFFGGPGWSRPEISMRRRSLLSTRRKPSRLPCRARTGSTGSSPARVLPSWPAMSPRMGTSRESSRSCPRRNSGRHRGT